MVLTEVLAEICMSAGPKSVAPVSRPETAMTADIIRCSMKGRAMMISTGSHLPAKHTIGAIDGDFGGLGLATD